VTRKSFVCTMCTQTFEGNPKRKSCDECKPTYLREMDRKRSIQRRNTPTEISCVDCNKMVKGDRRKLRCPECVKNRQRQQQRDRRGTPTSFECQRCGETFPVSFGEKGALRKFCAECLRQRRNEANNRRYWEDPEKARKRATDTYWKDVEAGRKYKRESEAKRRADPETNLHTNRLRRARNYGLTFEQSVAVETYIGRPCAICSTTITQRGKHGYCVDHDHETGIVRGIICSRCNTALGLFEDNPDRLRTALSYLQGVSATALVTGSVTPCSNQNSPVPARNQRRSTM
jgi:Zn finger protein HypA/HybF involved in hydrogenase expression